MITFLCVFGGQVNIKKWGLLSDCKFPGKNVECR